MDVLFVKTLFFLLPGVLGSSIFLLTVYKKISLDFKQFIFFSSLLSSVSYSMNYQNFLSFINSTELNLNSSTIWACCLSLFLGIIFSFFVNLGLLEKIFLNIFSSNYNKDKTVFNTVFGFSRKKYEKYFSEWTVIRHQNGTRYVGKILSTGINENFIEFFMTDVDVYASNSEEVTRFLKSIYISFPRNEICIEYLE